MSSRIVAGGSVQQFPWRPLVSPIASSDEESHDEVVAEELERKVNDALLQGRREGVLQGEQTAMRQLEPLMAQLARTIEDLASTRRSLRRDAEEDVVRLSVAIARRILNREISVDPDALVGMVNVALTRLDAKEVHRVLAHPDDANRIRLELSKLSLAQEIQVLADSKLEPGSVLFETTRGVLDASVATQLQEIERGLVDLVARRS